MTLDAAAAAAERTEVAVQLIEQAQRSDFVELVTVSALELCALGGPKHPLVSMTAASPPKSGSGPHRYPRAHARTRDVNGCTRAGNGTVGKNLPLPRAVTRGEPAS